MKIGFSEIHFLDTNSARNFVLGVFRPKSLFPSFFSSDKGTKKRSSYMVNIGQNQIHVTIFGTLHLTTFRLFSGFETYFSVFTDPDLGGLGATDRQKIKSSKLHTAKSRFLGHFINENRIFWDPLFGPKFDQKRCFWGF